MSTETLTVTPSAFELIQIFNDESFRDAAGGVWASGRNGNRWQMILTFNNLAGADRRALWAHVAQLRGQQNRLQVNASTLSYALAGAGGGTPLLVGAHSAGAVSLSIDGASNDAAWLAAGDFVSVGNELKIVTGAVTTTGGAGDIGIWPELHQDYANNAAVNISTQLGVFFLMESQGLSAVPHPADDSGTPWLSPTVTLVLEEDVYA